MITIKNKFNQKLAELNVDSLAGVDFRKINLRSANLANADLSGANFERCDLTNADLRNANLSNANLNLTILDLADAAGANFYGAELHKANISCLNHTNSNLIVAGIDARGHMFYATGNANRIIISNHHCSFNSISDARTYWQKNPREQPYLKAQRLAFLDTIEKLATLKGWPVKLKELQK